MEKKIKLIDRIVLKVGRSRYGGIVPDKRYLKAYYYSVFGKELDLDNPKTYNEKLQWLKLFYRRPVLTEMVDKIAAKDYVKRVLGSDENLIKTICCYDSVEEIEWDRLPNQFVLKCTHDSGGMVVCKDKNALDIDKARATLSEALSRDFFNVTREWPYKGVPRRIICEEYMVDESGYELKDYKFFCFNGEPKALFIATDRGNPNEETKFDFFDMEFNHLPIVNGHENSQKEIKKPLAFEEMKRIAQKLSSGFPHVRVDLYDINGHVYFGELTFYHWSGFVPFVPNKWDNIFGDWLILPKL